MALIPAGLLPIKRLLAIGGVVVLLAIGSLAILVWAPAQAGPPRGGLTRTQAIEAAWPHADAGAVGVVTSEVRKDFNTGEWVAIDYSTGGRIASQYSYQARP